MQTLGETNLCEGSTGFQFQHVIGKSREERIPAPFDKPEGPRAPVLCVEGPAPRAATCGDFVYCPTASWKVRLNIGFIMPVDIRRKMGRQYINRLMHVVVGFPLHADNSHFKEKYGLCARTKRGPLPSLSLVPSQPCLMAFGTFLP